MRFRRIGFAMVSLTTLAAMAGTAGAASLGKGTLELSPSFAVSRASFQPVGGGPTSDATQINLNGGAGWCFNKNFEMTGAFLMQRVSKDGTSRGSLGLTTGAMYNFETKSKMIPFASLGLGFISYSDNGSYKDRSMLAPMINVGVRSMLNNNTSVNFTAGYQHENNPESVMWESSNAFSLGVGMSWFRNSAAK